MGQRTQTVASGYYHVIKAQQYLITKFEFYFVAKIIVNDFNICARGYQKKTLAF